MIEGDETQPTIDLIRWSFTAEPERAPEIEAHLADLGLDVLVRDGVHFLVSWDEPEGNVDEIIEAIWELNGAPFDVTQEEFQRRNLLHLQFDQAEASA